MCGYCASTRLRLRQSSRGPWRAAGYLFGPCFPGSRYRGNHRRPPQAACDYHYYCLRRISSLLPGYDGYQHNLYDVPLSIQVNISLSIYLINPILSLRFLKRCVFGQEYNVRHAHHSSNLTSVETFWRHTVTWKSGCFLYPERGGFSKNSAILQRVTCYKLLLKILCQIHTQRAPTEMHLKTIGIHSSKWTRRRCLFETLEKLLTAEFLGFAQILKSPFCTFEVLRALHSVDDLLDSRTVFFFHLFSLMDYW